MNRRGFLASLGAVLAAPFGRKPKLPARAKLTMEWTDVNGRRISVEIPDAEITVEHDRVKAYRNTARKVFP